MTTPFQFSMRYLKEIYNNYVEPLYEDYFTKNFDLDSFGTCFIENKTFKLDRIYFEDMSPHNLSTNFAGFQDPIPHEFEDRILEVNEVEELLEWFIYQKDDGSMSLNNKSWSIAVSVCSKFLGSSIKMKNGSEVKASKLCYSGWEYFDKKGNSMLDKYLQCKNKNGKMTPYKGEFSDKSGWKMYLQLKADTQLSDRASELCEEYKKAVVKKELAEKFYSLMGSTLSLAMKEGKKFHFDEIKAHIEKLSSRFFNL